MNINTKDQFLKLENEVWSALTSGDISTDARLLATEFLDVYPSGFAEKADHTNQLKDGPTVTHYDILEARVHELSEETVLLSYLPNYARFEEGKAGKSKSMYVTSI